MGDFQLSRQWGSRFHLVEPGALELRLDPALESILANPAPQALSENALPAWLQPDWSGPDATSLGQLLRRPVEPVRRCVIPRGAGPAQPRAGKPGDVLKAVWGIPCVQDAVGRVFDQASSRLRSGWNSSSTGERVFLISVGTAVAGSALTGVLASDRARGLVLEQLSGRDISVPGVDGLKFHLRPRGGGLTVPLGVRGLSGRASVNADPHRLRNSDYDIRVDFDVLEFLRSR